MNCSTRSAGDPAPWGSEATRTPLPSRGTLFFSLPRLPDHRHLLAGPGSREVRPGRRPAGPDDPVQDLVAPDQEDIPAFVVVQGERAGLDKRVGVGRRGAGPALPVPAERRILVVRNDACSPLSSYLWSTKLGAAPQDSGGIRGILPRAKGEFFADRPGFAGGPSAAARGFI